MKICCVICGISVLACACVGIAILVFSLYQRGHVSGLSNGFYTRTYKHWDGTARLSLYLERHGDSRLITEAVVVDGVVCSLMPTIERWGTPERWDGVSDLISYDLAAISVLANGKLFLDGKTVSSYDGLPDSVRRRLISMSITTPIALSEFINALESVASIAETGLLVQQ